MPSAFSNILLSPFRLLTWSVRQLTSTLLFLFSPFFIVIYYASYVFAPIYAPLSVLERFEPVYIFCGTAAVIGISVGCLLGLTNSLLYSALSLTPTAATTPSQPTLSSPTPGIKKLRDERRKRRSQLENQGKLQKRQQKVEPARTPPLRKPKAIPTILEEEDEEEYYGTTTPAESLGGREPSGLTPLSRKIENHSDTDEEFGF